MEEKRILENILVAQTLVIAEQLRLQDEKKGIQKFGVPYPDLESAIEHISKSRGDILTALRIKGLL